jgi:hypothetical protein
VDDYMIAQTGAVLLRHPGARVLARRAQLRAASSLRWPALALGALNAIDYQDIVGALKLAAGAFAGAAVTLAILNYQDSRQEATAVEPVRNETVVYRQDRPSLDRVNLAPTLASVETHPYTEQVELSDDIDDDGVPANFPRAVQTVSFVNPDQPMSIGTLTAAARQSIKQALVKVGGFVAFSAKPGAETETDTIAPRKRTGSIMDEVDDYLWEVYQREPIKKDGTGDFTWKDPAAAKRMGLALQDYVIGGMDPEFREQLYHAGKAMDAAGVKWSMLSAFRDDYRQRLASGFKARVGNSLHGGSRRTGGYGHGRAIDITGADGTEMGTVWNWIDAHGGKYGLNRPMPGADPAHIQQRGDAHSVAVALREQRVGSTELAKASTGKTKVAKASSR